MNSFRTLMRIALLCGCALGAVGCSTGDDHIVFATNTSLAVDIDSAPPVVNVGYNRTEGLYGDVNQRGSAPPVVGSLRTNGRLFGVEHEQLYATGCASLLVQENATPGEQTCGSDPNRQPANADRRMFFGTNTNFGLGLTFSATGPQGFHFGLKRKEVSVLPRSTSAEIDSIPSVIAALNIGSQSSRSNGVDQADFGIVQFIGSGQAADALARNGEIQDMFSQRRDEALTGLEQYDRNVATQYGQISLALQCYLRLDADDRYRALRHADDLGLLDEGFSPAAPSDAAARRANDRAYAMTVGVEDGASAERTAQLGEHENFVCGLAST